MQIQIEYGTQVRVASGKSRESITLEGACTLSHVLTQVLAIHPQLAPWIDSSGRARPGLLVFVNDASPASFDQVQLKADDHIALLTMISGG